MLLAVVGFAVVTQVRTNTVDDTYAGLREQDLIDILNGLAGPTQRAQAEIQRLEETRDDLLLRDQRPRGGAGAGPQRGGHAGDHRRDGPGDRSRRPDHASRRSAARCEVEPFIDMVQALRSAGAEAIQINGEVRVVASTSFQDVDGGILVDGQILGAPFVVDVIGGPEALVAALRFPNGPQDQFAEDDVAELTFDELTALDIATARPTETPVRSPG